MTQTFSYHPGPQLNMNRDQLIESHLSLVEFLADRMGAQVPFYMTRDDIVSAATLGLINAAQRFDSSKGVLFKTYAERRIRGAIIDEARKMDSFSRTLREKQSRVEGAIRRLENRLGRAPEEREVAGHLGCSIDHYRQLLQEVSHLGLVSLNKAFARSEGGRELQDSIADKKGRSPVEQAEAKALVREIASCLQSLSEKERQVISLYYYEELSQKEISEVLDLTEGRISQLHSQALIKLRTKIRLNREWDRGGGQ